MKDVADGVHLKGFLSEHESSKKVVEIDVEPDVVYLENGRDGFYLNFDFIIRNKTAENLSIRFMKAAIYDQAGKLVTYRHLNHNGVGTPGIHTIGRYEMKAGETIDVFNPFFRYPLDMPIDHIRYMFTFLEPEKKEEYYYGNIVITPVLYEQKTELRVPLKGTLTVLDGHDFYSHHRRFAMSIVRQVTRNKFTSNFSRYAVDFTVIGKDGNTRRMQPEEYADNYDFHFDDARSFYTDGTEVLAPADGEIVDCEGSLDDLYESQFNMEVAVEKDRISEIAGNYIIIRHNEKEYSHLFHLMKDSLKVVKGDFVKDGDAIAKIGFSGAATTYSHLHYQLLDGPDFLSANPLPCMFSNVTVLLGEKKKEYKRLAIDTGDIIISE